MGAIAAITALSVGSKLITANAESKAIKAQSEFQASQLEGNAAVTDIYAKDAIQRGEQEVNRFRITTRQELGASRAALAAQGYDLSQGTALDIQQDIVGFGAEDVETIRNNAWRESFGYKTQALEQRTQAQFTRTTGKFRSKQAILTGVVDAAGDVAYGNYISSRGGSTASANKQTINPSGRSTF